MSAEETPSLRAATIRIDVRHLERLLRLPKDHNIVRLLCPHDAMNAPPAIQFVVSGPEMPEVKVGEMVGPYPSLWMNVDGSIRIFPPSAEEEESKAKAEDQAERCRSLLLQVRRWQDGPPPPPDEVRFWEEQVDSLDISKKAEL